MYIGRWLGCNPNPNLRTLLAHTFLVMAHLTSPATNVSFFIVPCMRQSCVNRRFVLGCANFARATLLLLVLLLLLLLLLLLTPVMVCGFVASGMQCLLNIRKMLMVNCKMTKTLASSCKGN